LLFCAAAWTQAVPVGFARNTLHGPGLVNLDLSFSHDSVLSQHKESPPKAMSNAKAGQKQIDKPNKSKDSPTLTVTVNSFNVFIHPNYVTYVGVLGSPFFGQPVSANPARRTQLNLECRF
jgi:hypothetical protein